MPCLKTDISKKSISSRDFRNEIKKFMLVRVIFGRKLYRRQVNFQTKALSS